MSTPGSQYDLLFSVLALQNKFVLPDQLIAALNFWAIDKRQSLTDLVAERGAISDSDRQLLQRLVQRQLEVHGDVESSLCQNGGIIDLAEHGSQIDDFELREQLESLANQSINSQLTITRVSGHEAISGANSLLKPGIFIAKGRVGSESQGDRIDDQDQTQVLQTDLTTPDEPATADLITAVRGTSPPATCSGVNYNGSSDSELDATAASRPVSGPSNRSDPNHLSFNNASPAGLGESLTASRFSILNSHAKGGLGEVFLARDNELDREVALKEIQRKFATNEEARVRFELEACITGGLEHPGVVPVYAYGKYPDGRPFYAMRFIRGRSMKDEIANYHKKIESRASQDELRLALRGLLTRFVDTCQAIGYAHSRGVVHRDLKPANVMLGKYGETLVVDWGLAKSVGRDEYHYSPD